MKVKVKLFGHYRYILNSKEIDLDLEGDDVNSALSKLISIHPDLGNAIMDGKDLRPYVSLLVNGKSLKEVGGLNAKIKDEDEIIIFPPMAGG